MHDRDLDLLAGRTPFLGDRPGERLPGLHGLRLELSLGVDEQRTALPDHGPPARGAGDQALVDQLTEGEPHGVAADLMGQHELHFGRQLISRSERTGVDGPPKFGSHQLIQR